MILTFDLTGEGDEYKKLPYGSTFGPYTALIDSGDQGNVVHITVYCTSFFYLLFIQPRVVQLLLGESCTLW